jgi:hypothetical protein
MSRSLDSYPIDFLSVLDSFNRSSSSECIPGCYDISRSIRAIITDSLRQSPKSRHQVAARMSELLGREITKAQLDAFSAESKENHRFPLEYLPAFVEATGDRSLIRFIAEKCMGYYIENADALHLELGRIHEQEKVLKDRKRIISSILGGLK